MPIFNDISRSLLLSQLQRTLGVHKWSLNLQTGRMRMEYGRDTEGAQIHELNIDELRQLLNADDMRLHREHWDAAVRHGHAGPTSLAFVKGMGHRAMAESVCALFEAEGQRYLIGYFKRQTQKAELSRNARMLTEFLESFIANSPSGIVVVDASGHIVSANRAFLRFVGKATRTEALQQSALDMMSGISPGLGQVMRDALKAPNPVKGRCEVAYSNGLRQTLYWRAFPLSMDTTTTPPRVFAFDLNEQGARIVAA